MSVIPDLAVQEMFSLHHLTEQPWLLSVLKLPCYLFHPLWGVFIQYLANGKRIGRVLGGKHVSKVGMGLPLIICHVGKVMFVVGYEGVLRFLAAFRHNVSVNFDQNCIANAVLILVERGPIIYRTLRCSELNAVSRLN